MAENVLSIQHIVSDPDIFHGQPRVAGRRVTVGHVSEAARSGKSAQAIAEQFDLTLAQVYAALAYYHDHAEDIERQMREAEERANEYRKDDEDA